MYRHFIAFALLLIVGCDDAYQEVAEAERDYARGQYAAATEGYRRATASVKPGSDAEIRARHNWGTAHLAAKEPGNAIAQLLQASQRLARKTGADAVKVSAYYNLGNAFYLNREYARAVDTYTEALKIDPTARDAKHNLELALEQVRQQMSTGGAPDDDTPQPSPRPGDGEEEPLPQQPVGMSQDEAERLLDMLGGDDLSRQRKRLQNMLPPRRSAEKDW